MTLVWSFEAYNLDSLLFYVWEKPWGHGIVVWNLGLGKSIVMVHKMLSQGSFCKILRFVMDHVM
jgi:hypothetical protein